MNRLDGRILLAVCILSLMWSQASLAIHLVKGDDGKQMPWSMPMEHPLDQPVNAASPDFSFLMNLGPTGIRAMIEPENPKAFKVMFVFQDAMSPAKGKINKGDIILGANGKDFKDAHGFHRKQAGGSGWVGPPFEIALAIEDSQGKDGKLDLTVLQGGDKNKRTTVNLQLKPVGRFAPTYPWNCPRTDKLNKELLDFIFEDGVPKGRPATIQCLLALWASGDKRAIPLVKAQAEGLAKGRANPNDTGMVSWMWGYHGIFLGEYYNAFKDKSVIPAIEALNTAYELGQDWGSGGFSHRPEPYIQQRLAADGTKGYGSMAGPGGLSMLAQSIFKAGGLPVSQRAYNRTHWAYIMSAGANPDGGIAYGFSGGYDHAVIAVKDATKGKSGKGIGYMCPTGMKDIGEYTIVWPTKADPRWKDTSWIAAGASKNSLLEAGANNRVVYNDRIPPEPTGPYSTGTRGGGHNAPVGMGALAHYIGNKGNQSWNWLGKHMATCCAYSPGKTWDGHACGEMHAFFNILGAARADEKDFRRFLDYYKTLIILSETHDGKGLVEQPFGTERYGNCSGIARNRKIFSYTTILLFSIPKRVLLITGADYAQPAGATTASAHSSSGGGETPISPAAASAPALRTARTLSDERRAVLDRSLQATLAKLSDDNALKPLPLIISLTRSRVSLKKADSDGALTFQVVGGAQTADFKWKDLAPTDRATLSQLVAVLNPESSDAQALAGVYMESIGKIKEADDLFAKAGEQSRKKLEKLFD